MPQIIIRYIVQKVDISTDICFFHVRLYPNIEKEGVRMKARQEVANRLIHLCSERGLAFNQLAYRAAVPPSTLKSILNGDSRNPGIVTIKMLCDGLDISLYDFFDSDAFRSTEPEDL